MTAPAISSNPQLLHAQRRWGWLAATALLLFVLIYVLAVFTPLGQSLENAALAGAKLEPASNRQDANDTLRIVSVTSLGVSVVVIGLIGLLRRRLRLAVAGVSVIVGGVLLVEVLKRFVLPRPDLVSGPEEIAHNSFPSGHTFIAMSILVATMLVVSYRWRGLAMLIVMTWATAIGAATIAAHWHRLSDTLGSALLALALSCLASLWLSKNGIVDPFLGRRYPLRVTYVVVIALAGTVALIVGIALAWLTIIRVPAGTDNFDTNIYLAVHALASAGSMLTGLVFWGSWRRLETVPG